MFLSPPDKAQQGQKKKKNVTKSGQECLEIDSQFGFEIEAEAVVDIVLETADAVYREQECAVAEALCTCLGIDCLIHLCTGSEIKTEMLPVNQQPIASYRDSYIMHALA